MASSHDTPLIARICSAASHLHHLNKPVPHFLMEVHDTMIPHIENLQTILENRGWAPGFLPPFLSTLQARLTITGLAIAFGIFLVVAALPRPGRGKNEKAKVKEEVESEVSVVEEAVGEADAEMQESLVAVKVVKTDEPGEEKRVDLETQPVTEAISMVAEEVEPATPVATSASPPSSEPRPIRAPVSKKETKDPVDRRSSRTESSASYRTSPIRTRSSMSSIPVRMPTTPARASSYPIALNTAFNKHASTPSHKITSSTTSPASAKVVAASYAWVMSEGLEWNDGGSSSETEDNSYNSGSHSDGEGNNDGSPSSPRSRSRLEAELTAAGYEGDDLDGEDDDSSASDDDDDGDKGEEETAANDAANVVERSGALHPRHHSHTSDIEARYEEWRKTRASQPVQGGNMHQQKSTTLAPVGELVGSVRKARKDSVVESPTNSSPGRSSLSMSKTVGAVTRHALQRKRSSVLKPWARKRKEDFGEWLKKKTTTTTSP